VDEISATVQAQAMLEEEGRARLALYPRSLHGLTALVYALVTLADEQNLPAAIDVMAGIGTLAQDRIEPEFARLPLGELVTYGFELLIDKALAQGWQEAFRTSASYTAYIAAREK
jgi:hypothetical protein